jgi:hypothetical protein
MSIMIEAMKPVKVAIGDEVTTVFGDARVTGIEEVKPGEKYGRRVESYEGPKGRVVVDTDDEHWVYGEQIIQVWGA